MTVNVAEDRSEWPAQLRPGAIRFAHASSNYDRTVAFYRDLVGLAVLGDFADSYGSDGTIFGLPDASVQLEIVRAGASDSSGTGGGSDQLVPVDQDQDPGVTRVCFGAQPLGGQVREDHGLAAAGREHDHGALHVAVLLIDGGDRLFLIVAQRQLSCH